MLSAEQWRWHSVHVLLDVIRLYLAYQMVFGQVWSSKTNKSQRPRIAPETWKRVYSYSIA